MTPRQIDAFNRRCNAAVSLLFWVALGVVISVVYCGL